MSRSPADRSTTPDDLLVTAPAPKPRPADGEPIFGPADSGVTAPGRPIGRPLASGPATTPAHAQSLVMGGVGATEQIVLGGGPSGDDRHAAMLGTTPLLDLGRFVPGTMLGQRYRIAGRLGKGGMGEVYRADDLKLGQSVAMKFLPEELSQDVAALTRLINEVKIARQVSHPNVCRVYDISDIDGLHFISMEFVDGEDLGTLLRRIGRLPHDKAVQIARQMCAGMQAAHEKGVLHRDLKPANIMIDGRGAVRIMDFGLAGLAEELKQGGSRAGTPAYMAPEQLHGKGVTARSDVYSLGLVLYEMFTGKPAYRPQSMAELTALHERPLPSLRVLVPEIPENVDAAVMRCLEREPAARHGSAVQVAAALGGQDPLAAALAAGEMPSPELVAASGGRGTLSLASAACVLGGLVVLLLAVAGLNPSVRLYETDRPSHPSVLVDKAQELLRKIGADRPLADSAYGFFEERLTADPAKAEPLAAMRFWYRQSPTSLISTSATDPVGPSQPPLDKVGMNLVILDAQGRVIKLEASPTAPNSAASTPAAAPTPAADTPSGTSGKPDYAALLALASVPPGPPTPVPPEILPRIAADSRAAWEWKDAAGRTVRCEAAAVGVTPVYFEVFPRWLGPASASGAPDPAGGVQRFFVTLTLALVGYGGPIALAWYNLRLGRGDRRGAMRLALFVFGFSVLARILLTRLVLDGELFDLFEPVLGRSVFLAAEMWVLYIGIEPFIRQAWPQSLISWNRLLAGDLRDGLVGRDLLFGCTLGAAWTLLVQGLYLAVSTRQVPLAVSTDVLVGLKPALGQLIEIAHNAVFNIFIILLLVPVAKALVRKLVPASLVVFAVLALFLTFLLASLVGGTPPGNGVAILGVTGVLLAAGATYVLSRFGGLMLIAAFFSAGILLQYPLTLDASRWYFAPSVTGLLAIGALAAFGFRRTIAKRVVPAGWN